MTMKIKDKFIESAVKAVVDSNIVNEGKYNKEYKGYISAFGAAIIQSGLLPAVIFYENSSRSMSEKKNVIDAIVRVLKSQKEESYNIYKELPSPVGKEFSDFIIRKKEHKTQIMLDVNEAAVSIKLAIRTFEESKA